MFHHVKELQFNARVSRPDPRFARLLLEQFGGSNGELKAAMQYFTQAFGCKQPYPDKYDLLMDIGTEEFSHLEIVGATIQMLLSGVSGELKEAADSEEITTLLDNKTAKDGYMHEALTNPHFDIISGGSPALTDSNGVPWTAAYVTANNELTVDMRSNMAAESRAKLVYERLMAFTDDPSVKETLRFLMTREIAHFQMFEAALQTIQPNFPPGVFQGDPRYSNAYFNMSNGEEVRGPWNQGESTKLGETFDYIENPVEYVRETNGLVDREPTGTARTDKTVDKLNKALSKERSMEIKSATPTADMQWSNYNGPDTALAKPKVKKSKKLL